MQKPNPRFENICSFLPLIRKFSRSYCFVGADADDIMQDTIVKLLSSRSIPAAVQPSWLRAVVHNVARDRYRKEKRESRYLDRNVSLNSCGSVCENGYQSSVYVSSLGFLETEPEFFPLLKKTVANMKKPLRETLLLHAAGLTYLEIAIATKTPLGTVRSRLHHARKHAQRALTSCS